MDINTFYYYTALVITAILGLCVGSFLNVVIYRVPLNMNIAKPNSHCPKCNYELKWYDNIPVLSYIILGGKCRKCKEHISFRYTLVELGNALLWVIGFFKYGISDYNSIICTILFFIASSVCVCIFFIDLEHQIILDRFQIILGICAIVYTIFDKDIGWLDHILGGVFGFLSFLLIGLIVSKKLGKEALGGGDIKFALVSGLYLGWQSFIIMALMSSISALIAIIISKKGSEKEFPFAPFLTIGFIISLLVGTLIIKTYLKIIGLE